jgi:hypothetical protein
MDDLTIGMAMRTGPVPGCDTTILDVSLLSDLVPGRTELELFGPGHGGTPRGIDSDGQVAIHLRYVDEQGLERQAIGRYQIP